MSRYGLPEVKSSEIEGEDHFLDDVPPPYFPKMETKTPIIQPSKIGNVSQDDDHVLALGATRSGIRATELQGSLDSPVPDKHGNFAVAQLQNLVSIARKNLRSLTPTFRLFVEIEQFSKPATGAIVVDRMERNFRLFFYHYALISAAMFVLCALFNPAILFLFLLCSGICAFVAQKGYPIKINDNLTLSVKQFQGCILAVGGTTMLLFAGNIIMMTLFGCALMICLHASLHQGVSYEQIAQLQGQQSVNDVV